MIQFFLIHKTIAIRIEQSTFEFQVHFHFLNNAITKNSILNKKTKKQKKKPETPGSNLINSICMHIICSMRSFVQEFQHRKIFVLNLLCLVVFRKYLKRWSIFRSNNRFHFLTEFLNRLAKRISWDYFFFIFVRESIGCMKMSHFIIYRANNKKKKNVESSFGRYKSNLFNVARLNDTTKLIWYFGAVLKTIYR